MAVAAYYPFRSHTAKDFCFAYIDSLAAKQWPVASEERIVPTTFGPTFVRITGPRAAPPLVLLHGAGGTSLMWAPNVEALSAEYRTFAVDQMNDFGRSLCTRKIRSVGDFLDWLDDLFTALKLTRGVNLAGMSFGGALAAQYALHFPGRLNKLILLAPGNTVLHVGVEFWLRLVLAAISRRRFVPAFLRWIFADMEQKDPKWIDATLELLRTNMQNMQRRKTPIPGVLSDEEWRALKVPVLFLVGEHEVIYSPARAVRRLNRVAPQVTAEIVPGAGHDLTFVQSALVNKRILRFLKGEAAAARA